MSGKRRGQAKMSISSLFKDLGTPLKNIRWSWGAVDTTGGTVFLRVWKDETLKWKGKDVVRLTNRAHFEGTSSLGYAERKQHIERLRQGATGYLIFCEAKAPISIPRKLKSYDSDSVFPTTDLCEINGDVYVQFLSGVKAAAVTNGNANSKPR